MENNFYYPINWKLNKETDGRAIAKMVKNGVWKQYFKLGTVKSGIYKKKKMEYLHIIF